MASPSRSAPGLALVLPLAAAGGLCWGLAFGREPRAWLPLVALVALAPALGRRRPFGSGWLFGTIAWLAALPWIVPTALSAISTVSTVSDVSALQPR